MVNFDDIEVGKDYVLDCKKSFMFWGDDDNEILIEAPKGSVVKVIAKAVATHGYRTYPDWAFVVCQLWDSSIDDCGESLVGASFLSEVND